MKKPNKKEIEAFVKENFPQIHFDGIMFEESKQNCCWFKIISFGRMIGQADYELDSSYWDRVKKHLQWTFNIV